MSEPAARISVIVPVYNAVRFIDRLCSCFEAQTFEDFEVVFVDDGSADGSYELLVNRLCASKLHSRVIRQPNKGVSSARNAGLDAAEGDYICFVDADDIICADYLSALYSAAEGSDAVMAYITRNIDELGDGTRSVSVFDSVSFLRDFLYRGIKYSICCGLYRRSLFDGQELRFSVGFRYSEDVHLLWRLFALTDSVTVVDCCLYYYYDNRDSAMNKKVDSGRLDAIALMRNLEPFMDEHAPQFASEFRRYAVARHYWSLFWQAAAGSDGYADFEACIKALDYDGCLVRLYDYPDVRVRLTSRLFALSRRLYYILIRIYVKIFRR